MSPIWKVNGYKFDLLQIKNEVNAFISEFPNSPQLCLTHKPGITDSIAKIFNGTGSLYDYDNNSFKAVESDFTEFNSAYKGTYLHEIYKSIPDIGRFRIMIAKPYSCYSMHVDTTHRYHIAVDTNPNAYLIFPECDQQLHHIPADGNLYKANTKQLHTAMNTGKENRIHLLLDDISTL